MDRAINILAYGVGWVAIDKPFDLSVHNADSSAIKYDCVHAVANLIKTDSKLREATRIEKDFLPSPVHRLDVGTSGVLLFALNSESSKNLSQEFEKQKTTKTYLAILKGKLPDLKLTWEYPLTDKAEGRRDPAGSGTKKPCSTSVEVIETNSYFTYAKIHLHTGRTHQIRRHAALAKHPVIGDERYSEPKYVQTISKIYGVDRLALHASELIINIDNKSVNIKSPNPSFIATLMNPASK